MSALVIARAGAVGFVLEKGALVALVVFNTRRLPVRWGVGAILVCNVVMSAVVASNLAVLG